MESTVNAKRITEENNIIGVQYVRFIISSLPKPVVPLNIARVEQHRREKFHVVTAICHFEKKKVGRTESASGVAASIVESYSRKPVGFRKHLSKAANLRSDSCSRAEPVDVSLPFRRPVEVNRRSVELEHVFWAEPAFNVLPGVVRFHSFRLKTFNLGPD